MNAIIILVCNQINTFIDKRVFFNRAQYSMCYSGPLPTFDNK